MIKYEISKDFLEQRCFPSQKGHVFIFITKMMWLQIIVWLLVGQKCGWKSTVYCFNGESILLNLNHNGLKCFSELKNGAEWPCFNFQGWVKKRAAVSWCGFDIRKWLLFHISDSFKMCFVRSRLSKKLHVRVVPDMFVGGFTCELLFYVWLHWLLHSLGQGESGVKSLGLMMCAKQPLA